MADGCRHHRLAAATRSGRPDPLRFFNRSRRDDERLWLRPEAGRLAMSAQGTMSSAPSSRALIVAFVVGAAIGAAAVLVLNSEEAKRTERLARRVVARAQSPD